MKFQSLFLIALLFSGMAAAQQIDAKQLKKHIEVLASDKLEGRGTGSTGEHLAADYLIKQFKRYGLIAKGTDGYKQSFSAKIDSAHQTQAANVVAYLDNGAAKTVVIGAHYDHLGTGEQSGSLDPNPKGKIHNGADDNASGVSGVLELARYFAKNGVKEQQNFLFICFSGEELGLLGSKYYANNPTIDLATVNYMINLDMIGRYDDTKGITIGGYGTSPTWGQVIPNLTAQANMKFRADSTGAGPSDHTSFYLKNLPVLFFFTGVHGDYHKPSDDANLINTEGEAKVLNLITSIVNTTDKAEKLTFRSTGMPSTGGGRTRFKVTLGLLPDYSFNGPGLKIDGVTDNRPAQKAGIKAGDLLIRIGSVTLNTIQDYMKALGTFDKGQTVEAEIQRGQERVILPVTF
jgi:hypothetical protein